MAIFKVGDRVRIAGHRIQKHNGREGVVTRVDEVVTGGSRPITERGPLPPIRRRPEYTVKLDADVAPLRYVREEWMKAVETSERDSN